MPIFFSRSYTWLGKRSFCIWAHKFYHFNVETMAGSKRFLVFFLAFRQNQGGLKNRNLSIWCGRGNSFTDPNSAHRCSVRAYGHPILSTVFSLYLCWILAKNSSRLQCFKVAWAMSLQEFIHFSLEKHQFGVEQPQNHETAC